MGWAMTSAGDPHALDVRRHPQLAAYLARLPDALASYPECRTKGTLITSALGDHDVAPLLAGLPAAVAEVLREPPLPSAWLPAVLSDAVFYVLVDAHYPTPEAMLAWTKERALQTARSPLYRALTRVSGPLALLRIASAAHGLFQRGTDLAVERGRGYVEAVLSHPPHLHGGMNHLSNVGLFEAVLEMTGVRDPRVEMVDSEPTFARYRMRWDQ